MDKLNKVCTNFEQDFTEAEKAQARRNIGAQQELVQGSNIEIVGNTISAIVPTPEPQPIPDVNDARLTIQQNGTTVGTFTANASEPSVVDIEVPVYTAGDDIKISPQLAISSLHGLKRYTRTQPTGNYGDMSEDPLVSGVYHIAPPHMVNNRRLNNVVYEYTVTDITDCMWIDLNAQGAPDSDGFVANMHYVIDLTGEIKDESGSLVPHKDNPYGRLSLNVGTSDPKDTFAGVYGRYIPISLGNKYLVDVYGNFVHISVLNRNRIENIADNFGDVNETLSTTPQTTSYTLEYSFEPNKAYHITLYTNAMYAESTDKFMYRIGIGGAPGAVNTRYLTGWNRVDNGKSIVLQLDFVSPSTGMAMWFEFDRDNYPMATQSVNLIIVGTKEDFT